jgi:iron complex transport system ATP-binding protein
MDVAVQLEDVSFFYPRRELEVENEIIRAIENPNEITQVFSHVTAELPATMMSLVGQNGIGKSTLLLLAGARLAPHEGRVLIYGTDSRTFAEATEDVEVEEERNRLVSFVYQNMEFESQAAVGELMEMVYENGFHEGRSDAFLAAIVEALQLEHCLHLKTQQLAKGQLQRAIIGFSLLYGSRIIMMDEPVFALEEPQKDHVFGFLVDFSRSQSVPIYYSAHNLDLTQKYSDYMLLFDKTGSFTIGPTKELFTRDRIEEAYQAPIDALHRRDNLYREMLKHQTAQE